MKYLLFLLPLHFFAQPHTKILRPAILKIWVWEQNPIQSPEKIKKFQHLPKKQQVKILTQKLVPKFVLGSFKTDGRYHLENPFVKMVDKSAPHILPLSSRTPDFFYPANKEGFEQLSVFYHINALMTYAKKMGHQQRQKPLKIDTKSYSGVDKSVYLGKANLLLFGIADTPDAQDIDIIAHEFFHFLVFDIAYNSSIGTERRAIEEGLADYLAVSYGYKKENPHWNILFEWGNTPYKISKNTAKKYQNIFIPIFADEHNYRDIWGVIFTDLLKVLGKTHTDNILFRSIAGLTSNIKMPDFATYILKTETKYSNREQISKIKKIFSKYGF